MSEPSLLDGLDSLEGNLGRLPDALQDDRSSPTFDQLELGRHLFFDPRLSADSSMSCASCHDPERGFADGLAKARGFGGAPLDRHTTSLFHSVFADSLGWDGAFEDLEDITYEHLFDSDTMNAGSVATMVDRLEGTDAYPQMFEKAFEAAVGPDEVVMALASFVRVLPPTDSAFDLFYYGDNHALDSQQQLGLSLFAGKAGCIKCHNGPTFSDGDYHDLGLARGDDRGRFEVTGRGDDSGRFRTPSLRDVARTAPYFHDGSAESLLEVIDFYDQGGGADDHKDSQLQPLGLTDSEKQALVAFLQALNGEAPNSVVAPQSLPNDL